MSPHHIWTHRSHRGDSDSDCGWIRLWMWVRAGAKREEFSLDRGEQGRRKESFCADFYAFLWSLLASLLPTLADNRREVWHAGGNEVSEVVDELRLGRTHRPGRLTRGGLVRTETNMKSRSQDQSLSDSRELDRSYDPLTGRLSFPVFFTENVVLLFLLSWLWFPVTLRSWKFALVGQLSQENTKGVFNTPQSRYIICQ